MFEKSTRVVYGVSLKSYKNIVTTCDNTKWTSASEVNLLVYRDDGWTTAETYVG
jgi:hypothetical protein